jgi:hypothetical protein
MKPTNNQKDLLFRISNYIREFVLSENLVAHNNKTKITKFIYRMVDEGVISEDDEMEAIRLIDGLIRLIGNND